MPPKHPITLKGGWTCHSSEDHGIRKHGIGITRHHLSHSSTPENTHAIPVFSEGYPRPFASVPKGVPVGTAKELLLRLGHKIDDTPPNELGAFTMVYLKQPEK